MSFGSKPKYDCPLNWNPARIVGTDEICCELQKIVIPSLRTSATAQVGPIERCPLYANLYVALTVFADERSAASTLPTFVVYRAGVSVFVSPAFRSQPK